MSPKFDVLAVGSYTIDFIFTGLPGLPELGKEVYSTGFDMIPGESYNSVVAMHRLGLKVGWAADFGNDDLSQMAMVHIRREGLDESLFVHHPRPLRRLSIAASLPHERSFITYYDPDPSVPAAMKALATTSARVFFVPGFYYGSLFEVGIKLVRLKGMKLVMDGNSGDEITLNDEKVAQVIKKLDLILLNRMEALRMTGKADIPEAACVLGALCPLVVIKAGPDGSYAYQDEDLIHEPAIPVEPLDTTGAGDCYNAGFLKAWLDGKPVRECLRWGNIVGGLSTLARGGTGRVVTEKDVREYLSKDEG
jgi:sugar/nucleoside kinase (ribokinase family)